MTLARDQPARCALAYPARPVLILGQDDDGSPGDRPPVVRFGRPLIMTERWVSIEATAVGIAICGLLGVFFGVRSSRRSRRLSQGGSSQRQQQRVHQD